MKFEHYLKRVEDSEEFKKFIQKNKKAYLCAGFFILDFETGKNTYQIDYALPNGKIATFMLDEGVKLKISEQAIKKKLPGLPAETKIDLEALKGIVEDEMKNKTVTEKIKKIIAVLHIIDGKPVWNLQCILEGLSMLNVHIDDLDKTILKFEKHSLLELLKQTQISELKIVPEESKEGEEEKEEKKAKKTEKSRS